MQFTGIFVTLATLATLVVGVPFTTTGDVVNDMQNLGRSIRVLRGHASRLGEPGFNMMTMLADNNAIIDGLDHIAKDATVAKKFTSNEAFNIISVTKDVAGEVADVSGIFIAKKDAIPSLFHGVVAKDLQNIVVHAKNAGDALIKGCPPDRRAGADKEYGKIGRSLEEAVKSFSA